MTRYGFIGTGSMGSILIRQFIGTGTIPAGAIHASSKSGTSAYALAQETGIVACRSNTVAASGADILFICVRPTDVKEILTEIRDTLTSETLLISIAGGVTLDNLAEWSGSGARYVKVIPSVPARQRAGISLVGWGRGVTAQDRILVLSLFNAIGTAVEIDEENFELYADLTSCGPGLIAAMLGEFAGAAVRTGAITPELASYLVRETAIGTGRLLAGENMSFDELIRRAATPGGITEEGITVLHEQLPVVFDELLAVTLEKYARIKEQIAQQK
jgi:pyrroline-5-carboxylate reductase